LIAQSIKTHKRVPAVPASKMSRKVNNLNQNKALGGRSCHAKKMKPKLKMLFKVEKVRKLHEETKSNKLRSIMAIKFDDFIEDIISPGLLKLGK